MMTMKMGKNSNKVIRWAEKKSIQHPNEIIEVWKKGQMTIAFFQKNNRITDFDGFQNAEKVFFVNEDEMVA